MFSYLCTGCGIEHESAARQKIGGIHPYEVCPLCGGILKRSAGSPAFKRGMQEHFNVAVGRQIHSDAQFRSELTRKSDEMSEKTGMDHRYVSVDVGDKEACGVTDEGLDTTARMRRATGLDGPTKRIIT